MTGYRVLPGPLASRAKAALAPSYRDVTDAVRAMGEGIVLDDGGRLVAFHETHLLTVTRLAATPASATPAASRSQDTTP